MGNLSSFFILTLVSFVTCDWIELSDDGPVTIDTPITFTVKNSYRTIAPSYEYRFKFEQFPQHDDTIVSTSGEVFYSVIFAASTAPKAELYTVQVDVWYRFLGVPFYSIGAVLSTFKLSDSLIGVIDVSQDIDEESLKNNFVSTASPVNLTAKIHDPSGFFDAANITFKWIVNSSPQEEGYDQSIIHNFTQPQINNISVIVSAITTTLQKSGLFEISLQSKDPIHNLTADGHTNVELFRDESLQLNIKIDGGTPPFFYCWEITNSTTLGKICKTTNESFFSIIRYFSEKGKKTLTTSVKNDVSSFTKNMTILIYEIEHRTQLSFVLVPVCSIIIAIFIIVAGIAIHMKQRKELTIEVADFDFQSIDERMERTFWERIRDSFTQSLKSSIFRPCTRRTDFDDFVDKTESDDILPAEPNISECNLRFSGDLDDSGVSGDFRS